MISLAEQAAEQRLRDGTASSQMIIHYLNLGSSRQRLEQKRLEGEVELQKAKIEAMASSQRSEEQLAVVIRAFRSYQGTPEEGSDENDSDLY